MSNFDAEKLTWNLILEILPNMLSSFVWVLVFFSTMIPVAILRRVLFPCVTLKGIRDAIEVVEKLLEGHIGNIQTSISRDECQHCMEILPQMYKHKQFLRRIRKIMNKIYDHDRSAPWSAYMSLTRLCEISSSYKILCASRQDIEHVIATGSNYHNEWRLEANTTRIALRRRNI
ncbi:hypothetical protein BDP27DRAFT_1315952, partial [Rhodocollybia butyracea]